MISAWRLIPEDPCPLRWRVLLLPVGFLLCIPREVAPAASASCLHHGVLEPWGPRAGRQGRPSDTHTVRRLPCLAPSVLALGAESRDPHPD